MYLSTLDSLVGFLWWVLSESLRLPPWGFFLFSCDEIRRLEFQNDKFYCFGTADEIRCQFVRPSVGRSTAFLPVVVSLYPLPSNPALWPVYGPVAGFYFFCCSRTFL